jgi:4-hydroxybenzoate polyprenyltransferase
MEMSEEQLGREDRNRGRNLRRQLDSLAADLGAVARYSSRYLRLMRLHRPIGIWLLLWPTLWALWFSAGGEPSQLVFAIFVAGTVIVRSAGCIVNDIADRKIDRGVWRTADRPLATGEVSVGEAVCLFLGLMLIAFGLVMMMNETTVLMAIAGALITIVYPFMKRLIAAPQLVLGLAFAWGVPMAFAAHSGEVMRLGWLLYVTALVWVLIYDTQYAMADRVDDMKLGIQSTAILFGDMDKSILAWLQLVLLGGLLLVGRGFEMGLWYHVGLAAACAFGLWQQYLIRHREPERCLQAFLNNAWLGAAVFAGIVLDYTFRTRLDLGIPPA